MDRKVITHVQKGLITVLALIVYDLIAHFAGFFMQEWVSLIWGIVIIGSVLFGTILYGKQMNGQVTFGNLFSHGFKMTTVIACIWIVYLSLSLLVIFPKDIQEFIAKGLEEARKQPNFDAAQAQKGMEVAPKAIMSFILAGSLMATLILGVVGALVGAAASKKVSNPFNKALK